MNEYNEIDISLTKAKHAFNIELPSDNVLIFFFCMLNNCTVKRIMKRREIKEDGYLRKTCRDKSMKCIYTTMPLWSQMLVFTGRTNERYVYVHHATEELGGKWKCKSFWLPFHFRRHYSCVLENLGDCWWLNRKRSAAEKRKCIYVGFRETGRFTDSFLVI